MLTTFESFAAAAESVAAIRPDWKPGDALPVLSAAVVAEILADPMEFVAEVRSAVRAAYVSQFEREVAHYRARLREKEEEAMEVLGDYGWLPGEDF